MLPRIHDLGKISSTIYSLGVKTGHIYSCILDRLHFCNALYFNWPGKKLYRLQKLLNAGARFIFSIYVMKRFQSITISYRNCTFSRLALYLQSLPNRVYKCINNQALKYLKCIFLPQIAESEKRTRQLW